MKDHFLFEISNVPLDIVGDTVDISDFEVLIGKTNRKESEKLIKEASSLGEDGFAIKTYKNKLVFVGGEDKGIIYSIYDFLEKQLECRKYSAEYTFIPKRKEIVLNGIDYQEIPASP